MVIMRKRNQRLILALIITLLTAGNALFLEYRDRSNQTAQPPANVQLAPPAEGTLALEALEQLEVKGRAPKTDYSRDQFGDGWEQAGACNVRNRILLRDLRNVQTVSESNCNVVSGTLEDPYTGKTVQFQRGPQTSDDVQIDHVVALSDAWQKGAQQLTPEQRVAFANDPLNLLAVDGPENMKKGDADAASWLPGNKDYRCQFVARQIAVKIKYSLWITEAEKAAMKRVLDDCPNQVLPQVSLNTDSM